MQTHVRNAGAILALLLFLGACGGSDGAPSSGETPATQQPDPCSLVTKEEAEAALGGTVTGPTRDDFPEGPICRYDMGLSRVQMGVHTEPIPASELENETAPGEKVEGIGDAAYWYQNLGDLRVAKGGISFGIAVAVNGSPSLEKAKSLAATAAARVG